MTMRKIRFEEMRPPELEEAVAKTPLAWIPVGTLEWHGRHLPVGLDALKAHAICERAALRAGGVVLPVDYLSMGGMMFPWTFKYPPSMVAAKMLNTLTRLKRYGFKAMVIITGHYPVSQILVFMGAAEAFMAATGAAVAAMPEFAVGAEGGYFGDHAAKWETSIMMELFPKLVNKEERERLAGMNTFELYRRGVYGENPGEAASRETGAAIVEEITLNLSALAKKLLSSDGRKAASEFHRQTIESFIKNSYKNLQAQINF